jgi:hypothetical protein
VLCTNGAVYARNGYVGSTLLGTCPALAQGTIVQWFVGTDTHSVPANQVVLADGSAYEYAPSAGWQKTDSAGVQQLYTGVDSS